MTNIFDDNILLIGNETCYVIMKTKIVLRLQFRDEDCTVSWLWTVVKQGFPPCLSQIYIKECENNNRFLRFLSSVLFARHRNDPLNKRFCK